MSDRKHDRHQRRSDPLIGSRATGELMRYIEKHDMTITEWCESNRCSREQVYSWRRKKMMPSAYWLKVMAEMGLDVIYILTGRRS